MADVEGGIQNLEFKSPEDDSWYPVSIYANPEGSVFFDVHYENGHRRGQPYSVNLNDSNQVEETIARFRYESTQLQDSQRGELQMGRTICAKYRADWKNGIIISNDDSDLLYFDAIIKQVCRTTYMTRFNRSSKFTSSAVTVTHGAEVLWKDGPSKGEITVILVNDIRLLSHGRIEAHPAIQFLERVLRENKKKASLVVEESPIVLDLNLRLSAPLALPDLNVPLDLKDDEGRNNKSTRN